MEIKKIKNPNLAKLVKNSLGSESIEILKKLKENNIEAYVVGGCTRDAILGIPCHDIDFCSNASMDEIKKIFNGDNYSIIDTGEKFGTVTILNKKTKEGFEITTFRKETEYKNSRFPTVEKGTLETDALRRDLTVNSIFFDGDNFVVVAGIDKNGNYYDSFTDLENHKIRMIGNPEERLNEDALRLMRTVRFSSKLDSTIEEETFVALQKLAPNINKISKERIKEELIKTIETNDIKAFDTLHETGILKEILPELDECYNFDQCNDFHKYDLFHHITKSMEGVSSTNEKVALLLHDIGKKKIENFKIKYDNRNISLESIKTKYNDETLNKLITNFREENTVQNFEKITNYLSMKGLDKDKFEYGSVKRKDNEYVSRRFIGHPEVSYELSKDILKRLKFSNEEQSQILPLIRYHDFEMNANYLLAQKNGEEKIKKDVINFFIENPNLANKEFIEALYRIKKADESAQNELMYTEDIYNASKYVQKLMLEKVSEICKMQDLDNLFNKEDKKLGQILMDIGYVGKEIKEEKENLLRKVMMDEINPNTNDILKQVVQDKIKASLRTIGFDEYNQQKKFGNQIYNKLLESVDERDNLCNSLIPLQITVNDLVCEKAIERGKINIDENILNNIENSNQTQVKKIVGLNILSGKIENNEDSINNFLEKEFSLENAKNLEL